MVAAPRHRVRRAGRSRLRRPGRRGPGGPLPGGAGGVDERGPARPRGPGAARAGGGAGWTRPADDRRRRRPRPRPWPALRRPGPGRDGGTGGRAGGQPGPGPLAARRLARGSPGAGAAGGPAGLRGVDRLIRILLVDDHAVVREGYRRFLERSDDLRVVGEAEEADEGHRLWLQCAPDVTVVDLSMRGAGGMSLLMRIAARAPDARCLVFSMYEDALVAQRALEAGARGYVTKSSQPEVLVQAVRAVHAGGIYLSADIVQRRTAMAEDARRLATLTGKEHETFRLLAQGRTVADIARLLNLSAKTVANHQSQIRDKLGVATPAALVHLALRHGLIESPAPGLG
ncbi:response regulator transcription factor [Ramlibacter monticola]|uniref:Response regulator transcription factor n=1 Tax=Ramlibacter monticola TaxID=1926872 RepID=A0A937CSL5_9BURK|nr:response regulator transcription factor [Ramlibacter monticola]